MASHRHTIGLHRREALQVGYSALMGVGLSTALSGRTATAKAKAGKKPKSLLIVFLTGAASHHDTFDMKPNAPAEVRGEFKPISTSIPGLHVCEHLPHLAVRAKKYSVIRTLSHRDNNHLMSTHHVLTGSKQPGGFFDKIASRDDWPAYAAGSAYLQPRTDGIPSGVNLPIYLQQGSLTWPGQHAGFLGPKYDPWQINGDPNKSNFRVDNLTLAPGISVNRIRDRQELIRSLNQQRQRLSQVAVARRLTNEQNLALSMLTSNRFSQSFDLEREKPKTRDQYGRNTVGQSLLLARRLIEVGVPVVQANIGRVQTWDSHSNIFPTLKKRLLPPLDRGVSTLLDDLEDRGLLEDTMVMMIGEFGRTPKINKSKGRDHWGPCFFAVFAGAGVQPGQVIGRSDKTGAYPFTKAYSPNDVGATVYETLGIRPDSVVRDRLNRPVRLNYGEVIKPLFSGEAV